MDKHIYIYVYVYFTYIYIYIYVQMYIYAYIYIYVYVYARVIVQRLKWRAASIFKTDLDLARSLHRLGRLYFVHLQAPPGRK